MDQVENNQQIVKDRLVFLMADDPGDFLITLADAVGSLHNRGALVIDEKTGERDFLEANKAFDAYIKLSREEELSVLDDLIKIEKDGK